MAHYLALIYFLSPQPDTSLSCKTAGMELVHHAMYFPAFAGTQCTHSWRHGQAELTSLTGNVTGCPQTVTHPSTKPGNPAASTTKLS